MCIGCNPFQNVELAAAAHLPRLCIVRAAFLEKPLSCFQVAAFKSSLASLCVEIAAVPVCPFDQIKVSAASKMSYEYDPTHHCCQLEISFFCEEGAHEQEPSPTSCTYCGSMGSEKKEATHPKAALKLPRLYSPGPITRGLLLRRAKSPHIAATGQAASSNSTSARAALSRSDCQTHFQFEARLPSSACAWYVRFDLHVTRTQGQRRHPPTCLQFLQPLEQICSFGT